MQIKIPHYLNHPIQMLWFEPDEIGIILIFYMLGTTADAWMFLGCVIAPYFYKKAKSRYPRGFLKHGLYALGFLKIPGYPNSFDDQFVE